MPGKIQVTQDVIDATKSGEFDFERRGMVDVKGIGGMETFFLNNRNVDIEEELCTSMRSMKSSFFASDILEILHSTDQLPSPDQSPPKASNSVRKLKSIPSDDSIADNEVSTDTLPES